MTRLITSGRVAVSLQVFVLTCVIAAGASAAPLLPFATLTVNGTAYVIPLTVGPPFTTGDLILDLDTGPVHARVRLGDGSPQHNLNLFLFLSLEATNESDLPLSLSLSAGTPVQPLDNPNAYATEAIFGFNVGGPIVPGPGDADGVTVTPFATDPDGDSLHELLTVFAGDPLVNLGFDVGLETTVLIPFGGFVEDGVQTQFLPWPDYPFLAADLSFVLSPGGDFARLRGDVGIARQFPEPASVTLIGLGLAGWAWRLRRAGFRGKWGG